MCFQEAQVKRAERKRAEEAKAKAEAEAKRKAGETVSEYSFCLLLVTSRRFESLPQRRAANSPELQLIPCMS
jgi:uncharacterized membrane protein YqiK